MYFYQFYLLALYVAVYAGYQFAGHSAPDWYLPAGVWMAWAFIGVQSYFSGRVIVSCLRLGARGEMTRPNVESGILLAVLTFLPTLLMAAFIFYRGFA